MITIQKDGYVFEVDIEKTKEYYKTHILCECDYCNNLHTQIKGKFPKLESFLAEFGVDISKPDETMPVEAEDFVDYINVDYTICGKVITRGQCKIDIHDNLLLSIFITDGFASPNQQTGDYFTISVCNIELPWVLDKPIHEAERTKSKSQFSKKKHQFTKDPEQCLTNIKRKIAEKTGITKCIDLDESSAAFSGTEEAYDLYVSVGVYKKGKKEYFSVYMDDHLEWDEFDYDSQEEFEDSIVEFICEKINRTIKTITETKKHKYVRVKEYFLDKETNEWVLMYDEKMSWLIARPFITEDSVTEEIKEYHI